MDWIERHKALIITGLVTGIVVFGMFSIRITKKSDYIAESYYELEPEPESVEEELQPLNDLKSPSTNKAFNEDQEYKDMMKNFKTVSPDDFERTTQALESEKANTVNEETTVNSSYSNGNAYTLKSDETNSYKKLQDQLKRRKDNQKAVDEHSKSGSTLTYSLKGRTLQYYKTPRYLCEYGGKIVVSIRVDENGTVYDASINGSSNSSNQCLVDQALEYAKSARFNSSQETDQLGTITFLFKGKR